MHRNHPHLAVTFLMLVTVWACLSAPGANAMNKLPEGATGENKSFKDLAMERDLARDRARDRLLEISQPAGDSSITVKIRRKSEEGTRDDRGEVIAEGKISKEDAEKSEWGAVYSKIKSDAGSTATARPVRSSRHTRGQGSSEREQTAVWLFSGLLVFGVVVGWWYSRRYQAI